MPKAFIFDMDGVLIDSNPAHKIALQQFCKKYGYELSEKELREKVYGRMNRDWLTSVFGDLPDEKVRQYADEKEALFRQLYHDIKPLDGLVDFLRKLDSEHIPRAIATSAPRVNVDFTLSRTELTSFFTTILDDSFVSKGKPDPEIYLKTVAALKMDAVDCIVFEDSLSGVKAGKAAGCKVVGIMTTHTAEELSEADFSIPNFLDFDPKTIVQLLF
ncbi:MAG: HAD family phosphatase [Chryseolinea sp.]